MQTPEGIMAGFSLDFSMVDHPVLLIPFLRDLGP
jgi:hypothetical protein